VTGVKLKRFFGGQWCGALRPFSDVERKFGWIRAADYVGRGFSFSPATRFGKPSLYAGKAAMLQRTIWGNSAVARAGGVQLDDFAPKNSFSSEMPQKNSGRCAVFQLWVKPARLEKFAGRIYFWICLLISVNGAAH